MTSAHPQRPLPSHAQRRDEAKQKDLLRRIGDAAQPHENRVGDDGKTHRPHPAQTVAEPAEEHAARGRADQKPRDHQAEPGVDRAFARLAQEINQRGPTDERKEPHLEAVEHPAQKGGGQRDPLRADGEAAL